MVGARAFDTLSGRWNRSVQWSVVMQKGLFAVFCLATVLNCNLLASQTRQITLRNEHWTIEVSPQTLEITASPAGKEPIQLSQGQPDLGRPGNLTRTGGLVRWDLEDGKIIARALEEMGFDYLGVSAGVYRIDILMLLVPTHYIPPLHFEPLAAAIKEVVSIPIMQYGRISSPEMAEGVLERGTADFVQMNRASWADPHLPNKALEGREEEIRHCIYCNNGCHDRLYSGLDTTCTMNPEAGRERAWSGGFR